MDKKKIQVGKTYIGRDGKRKTVTHIVATSTANQWNVYTIDHDNDNQRGGCGLSQFANWAVREDTSSQAMAEWQADIKQRRERQLAEQRKQAKRKLT